MDASHLIDLSGVSALRRLLSELPGDLHAANLQRFGQVAGELAWRADRPTLANITDTPMRYRRLLVSDPECAMTSALLISWPPGYRTALHNHDGRWGAEMVLDGALAVDEYQYLPTHAYPQARFSDGRWIRTVVRAPKTTSEPAGSTSLA